MPSRDIELVMVLRWERPKSSHESSGFCMMSFVLSMASFLLSDYEYVLLL